MLDVLLFSAGALLVAVVFFDFLWTTVSMSGSGPISSALSHGLWRLARKAVPSAEQHVGSGIRNLIGPSILAGLAAAWIILHLVGYSMMYAAGFSLEMASSGNSASLLDTVAFVGASLSTLGASIVEPTNGWWDVLSMIAAVNGMIVLTLSVSFLLNVLQITASARAFALRLHALTAHLAPDDTRGRLQQASKLGADLCEVVAQITASPLPGIFVPRDPVLSFPAAVRQLGELLTQADGELQGGDRETGSAELRWSLIILGRHAFRGEGPAFASACRWADLHMIANGRGGRNDRRRL